MHKSIWVKVGVLAAITAALSACSVGQRGSSKEPAKFETQIELDSSKGAAQRGIELRVFTVDDSADRVAKALARYEQVSGAMNEDDRERWRQWGLRWIVVPINKLDTILSDQDPTQAIQVRWMGEFPQWRPVIRTGELKNRTVRIGDSSSSNYQTFSGRPRLLARVWTTPEITDTGVEARLHLDLGIQMTQKRKTVQLSAPKLRMTLDDGPIIDQLKMSQVLDSSSALILVGEDPSVLWMQHDGSSEQPRPDEPRGPQTPRARTLGQYMLSTVGTGYVAEGMRYVPPKKVLIVLVPKAGGTYRLLGPTTQPPSQPANQAGTTP